MWFSNYIYVRKKKILIKNFFKKKKDEKINKFI